MLGSIHCLDKTGKKRRKPWAVRITTGWEDGKQQRKYLGYYRTKKEALLALAEYHKGGYNVDLTNITFKEVFDKWYEGVKQKNLSDSAMRSYKLVGTKLGKLGDMPMKDIKVDHLQQWMNSLDLKASTKGKIKSTVTMVFNYALANDIVTKNYNATVIVTGKTTEKVGAIFTDEEIALLWKNKDNEYVKQLLVLTYTGMRVGEMLAVKREDINFEEGYIIGGSKTEAGKDRVIPLHRIIIPIVKDLLGDNEWLVRSKNPKRPSSYTNVTRHYKEFFDANGITHKSHDCRKTAVSIMHASGIQMEVIRIIIGHSGKGVTESVYLRKTPAQLVEEVNKIVIPEEYL